MAEDVFIPYTGAQVIKVGGKCYELAEVVAGPIDEGVVLEGEYSTCLGCVEDGGEVGSESSGEPSGSSSP